MVLPYYRSRCGWCSCHLVYWQIADEKKSITDATACVSKPKAKAMTKVQGPGISNLTVMVVGLVRGFVQKVERFNDTTTTTLIRSTKTNKIQATTRASVCNAGFGLRILRGLIRKRASVIRENSPIEINMVLHRFGQPLKFAIAQQWTHNRVKHRNSIRKLMSVVSFMTSRVNKEVFQE